MATASATLNDVNLQAVGALAEQIRRNPELAKAQWKSEVHWQSGFKSRSRSRDLPTAASDEPAALGGDDTAANPLEQLLGALGNCLAVGYAANATVAGIRIKSLKLDLEGNMDLRMFLGLADGNAGLDAIRVTVHLDADAPPAAIKQLHEKVIKHSPVGHTLSRSVPLRVELA
jgi:uncharacterized OsmC-like protein